MVETSGHSPAGGAFWTGTITFGLVSIPVELFSAQRPKTVGLRMVDRHGALLHRRYYCPREQRPLEADELVRGYEIEAGRFVVVGADELAALEPRKSREIDLRCFVAVEAVDPAYFHHAYFLLPAGEVNKAYRLLAEVMERQGRAGIATFVMHDREHLVAILAQGGILRAEILRFAAELRSPVELGLPQPVKAPPEKVKQLRHEMELLQQSEFSPDLLHDRHAQRLLALVHRKLAAGEDVVEKPVVPPAEGAEIIDLMAIIKQRFQAGKQGAGEKAEG